jgi:hypothetical protein
MGVGLRAVDQAAVEEQDVAGIQQNGNDGLQGP